MYWTHELITQLEDAPFPCCKQELIDFATRAGLSQEVVINLQGLEEESTYESLEDIWPDIPKPSEDYLFNSDEY